MEKAILFGNQGFIGSCLEKVLKQSFDQIITTHYQQVTNELIFDFSNPNFQTLPSDASFAFGIVAAALCRIGVCEAFPEKTFRVNVETPLKLVRWMLEKGIHPVLFSTDYVFSGNDQAYDEDSLRDPLNEYGRQKSVLEEKALELAEGKVLILRLSKVYNLKRTHSNFFGEMAEDFDTEKLVRAASDQCFCPIYVEDVARETIRLAKEKASGIFHLVGPGYFSRYQIAKKILMKSGAPTSLLKEISLDDLQEDFCRPKKLKLISKKIDLHRFMDVETALNQFFMAPTYS